MNDKYIKIALKEAKKAYDIGEIPVGAVIVKDNIIISKAHNLKEKEKNVTKHAELIAITKANKKLCNWRLDNCILYTTLFPCPMCASAIQQARIKKIFYLIDSNNNYICRNTTDIFISEDSNHYVEISKLDYKSDLLKKFFSEIRKK